MSPSQFQKEFLLNLVLEKINSVLSKSELFSEHKSRFWSAIDNEIQMQDCEIYSFVSDSDSDPFNEEGENVWSLNYFFYNRKLKRVILVILKAVHKKDDGDLMIDTHVGESYEHANEFETWIYDEMEIEH